MEHLKYPERYWQHTLAFPFIVSMIVPLVIFDLCMELYHHICFPLYGIALVPRSDYIKIDRHKLSYLNWLQKIFCAYCGYANGMMHYSFTIAGQTEKYWCGIKHQQGGGFKAPPHHEQFLAYNDEAGFRERYKQPAGNEERAKDRAAS